MRLGCDVEGVRLSCPRILSTFHFLCFFFVLRILSLTFSLFFVEYSLCSLSNPRFTLSCGAAHFSSLHQNGGTRNKEFDLVTFRGFFVFFSLSLRMATPEIEGRQRVSSRPLTSSKQLDINFQPFSSSRKALRINQLRSISFHQLTRR